MQGAAALVRGAVEDDAAAGGEQHAAELQQQQHAEAADHQQLQHEAGTELQHAPRTDFQHASGAELKCSDAAGDQDDQAGPPGSLNSNYGFFIIMYSVVKA